ncbi:MAG: hypothetical protein ACR2F6_16730 [Mycobacteriales bacterium]
MTAELPAVGVLPLRWPSAFAPAGRALRPLIVNRAIVAVAGCLLTLAGLIWLGDPAKQWWAIVVPLLLLIDPIVRVARVRVRVRRAAARTPLFPVALVPERRGLVQIIIDRPGPDLSGRWSAPTHLAGPADLVYAGRVAAVVAPGGEVSYIRRI